jgi:hypothetical protein
MLNPVYKNNEFYFITDILFYLILILLRSFYTRLDTTNVFIDNRPMIFLLLIKNERRFNAYVFNIHKKTLKNPSVGDESLRVLKEG